jgi:hypothetical protein
LPGQALCNRRVFPAFLDVVDETPSLKEQCQLPAEQGAASEKFDKRDLEADGTVMVKAEDP